MNLLILEIPVRISLTAVQKKEGASHILHRGGSKVILPAVILWISPDTYA